MARIQDPRANYIAVATKLFGRDGFHGTSLASIAQEAGVSKQALLHFFGTKEKLYGEVLATLANRLESRIEATSMPDPVDHLTAYLTDFAASVLAQPADAKLVVRALVDSNPKARVWPMKPYLDKLTALTRSASRGGLSEDAARAWSFQIIGALQYLAISSAAIRGMYGNTTLDSMMEHHQNFVARSVFDLVKS